MNPLFRKNLDLFRRFNSNYITSIENYKEESKLEKPSPNEARNWFQSLESLDKVEVIYIFGIGNGSYFEAAKKWLHEKKSRSLVFFEDDLSVLKTFLQTEIATEILDDPQVIVQAMTWINRSTMPPEFPQIFLIFLKVPSITTVLKSYAEKRKEDSEVLRLMIDLYQVDLNHYFNMMSEKYMESIHTNFYNDLRYIPGSYSSKGLKKKFINVPAIICGAGPSISKILDQIGELSDRALIFGAGTGMNVLNKAGITAHLGGALDPNPASLSRLMINYAFETPYIYTNRFYHKALKFIHGPRIYARTPPTFKMETWFEKELNICDNIELPAQVSTTNFCMHIARILGCSPIILAGVDLAYTESARYPKGIVPHPLDETLEQKMMNDVPITSGIMMPVKNSAGETIYTRNDWLAEAGTYTDFRLEFPEMNLLNVTQGGLPIDHVPNFTLKEVKEEYLTQTFDLTNEIHLAIENSGKISVSELDIERVFEKWKKSLINCDKILEEMIQNKDYSVSRLKEEPFYQNYLVDMQDFFDKITLRERYRYIYFPEKFTAEEHAQRKKEYEETKLLFYKHEVEIHLTYLYQAMQIKCETQIGGLSCTQKDGVQEYYYENGQVKSQIQYSEGLLNGKTTLYFPDGRKKREIEFKQGKLHGWERLWNEQGILLSETYYENDVPSGVSKKWYPNGQIAKEMIYHGAPDFFDLTEWDQQGRVTKEEIFLSTEFQKSMEKESRERRDALSKIKKKLK